ncbi:MAG: 5-formyltetrahydrofolate cyclo-ligase [Bacteroidales bacterium]|nr:5-formyltetrahydrofolate cyclo-ligase [Bacteroidales bacterium]MBR5532162.1 5-formyltetrahydrofolate cyclo-ligase [Bacteroidales bacterium]
MNKPNIRKEVKKIKLEIPQRDREVTAIEVMTKIESLPQFQEAENILLYNALPDELPTACMLERWDNFKTLFLPVVEGENLIIKRYDKENVKIGAFGITEPLGDEIDSKIIDFIIVPGVAFDRNRNRLGRGKGYYDRLLADSNAYFVGVGYDLQVLEHIPTEEHDIKMNCIITEREIL